MSHYFSFRKSAPTNLLLFMISGVVSVLGVRLFLHLTNNFQLAFGSWHIAHVLWGGLLMFLALMLVFLFSSHQALKYSAIISGFGWGWFIDEVGKYITRDNNYLYRPAVIIIYISFILLFFLYRFTLTRPPPYSHKISLLNSLSRKIIHFRPLFLALSLYSFYYVVDKIIDIRFQLFPRPESYMIYLKLITDLLSASLIILGWFYYLSRRRRSALKLFRLSLLANIFLGAVIKFYFEQFSAVFSLGVNILILNYLNAYKTGKLPSNLLK